MITSYFTLRYIASTLHSTISGARIVEAFSQNADELVLAFENPVRTHLIISCRSDTPTCYLHPAFARAKRNSADLLPNIIGSEVRAVSALPGDRVIHVELAGGDLLAMQFFGPNANVLVVSRSGIIEDAFRHSSKTRGAAYTFEKRELLLDLALLRAEIVQGEQTSLFTKVRKAVPILGSTLSEELLVRAGVEPSTRWQLFDEKAYNRLIRCLHSMLAELENPQPRVYCSGGNTPVLFSLVPLRSAAAFSEQTFDDIHEAIRFFLSRRRSADQLNATKVGVFAKLDRLKQRTRRSIEAAEKELERSESADQYEEFGKLLLAHASLVSLGDRFAEVPGEGGPIRIPLDPRLSAMKNAGQYFTKSKRARTSHENLRTRIPKLRAQALACEEFISILENVHTERELETVMNDKGDAFGVGPKSVAREAIPFRTFTVEGGFAVWAGKNGANNDLLTMKHAKPNDLWFHARGASGSHVVLKVGSAKGEPGKRAREQAAAIAAYYSRMKTARTVPVAMTERKYVRKPKGSQPGSVVLEREKVLFVEPALPPNASDPEC